MVSSESTAQVDGETMMLLTEIPSDVLSHISYFCREIHNGVSITHTSTDRMCLHSVVDDPDVDRVIRIRLLRAVGVDVTQDGPRRWIDANHVWRCLDAHPVLVHERLLETHGLDVCNILRTERVFSFGVIIPCRALRATCRELRQTISM